jgi:pantothenate kinase
MYMLHDKLLYIVIIVISVYVHTHIYIYIQTYARRHLMNKRGRFTNAEIYFTRRNSGTKDKIVEQTKQNSNSLNRLNLERMRMAHTRYFTYTNSYMYGSTVL